MGTIVIAAPSHVVRDAIARLVLPANEREPALGEIQLRPHQLDGVTRIMQSFAEFKGALLCDEVGLGKTFTAASVMRRFSSTAVIAPAALLPMWKGALQRAGVRACLMSIEKFSRNAVPERAWNLVVIDEAHHFRNPRTRRFQNVATFVRASRLLLLSATPVHNRKADITSLLSLFLGSRAGRMSPADFSRCVIRRQNSHTKILSFPRRRFLPAASPPASPEIRRRLLSLPPPVPPLDGDDCSTLIRFTLLRQWASSDAALRAGLESTIGRARALIAALAAGTYPTRKELSSWVTGGTEVQLGFAELLASPGGDKNLFGAVTRYEKQACELLRALNSEESSDDWRVAYLRSLREQYPDRKIVAFSQFASTARHLYRMMRSDANVALVTAGGCAIASGRVSRRDVIHRFAPHGSGVAPPPPRENITLLIATDLCSEGLNLQDAGVVLHLDVPWTPARLEQRVGRIARPGSPHSEILVHTLRTPVIAEDLLKMEERLRDKSALLAQLVGQDSQPVASFAANQSEHSVADAIESLHAVLQQWRDESVADVAQAQPLVGHTTCDADCFVAVVGNRTCSYLIGSDHSAITNDPRNILRLVAGLATPDAESDSAQTESAIAEINRWLQQDRLGRVLGVDGVMSTSRRRLANRIDQVTRRTPMHSRAMAASLADSARRALSLQLNAGSEAKILALTKCSPSGDQWLQEVANVEDGDGKTKAEPADGLGFELLALLIGRKA